MKITKASHPFLHEAFLAIDHDSGRNTRFESRTEFDVPARLEHLITPAERALAAMTEDER